RAVRRVRTAVGASGRGCPRAAGSRSTHSASCAARRRPAAVEATVISLERLSARVGDFALEDVSFEVPQGAYGIVIGPTGAGKTTLVEAIAGLVAVTHGRMVLGGTELTHAPPDQRRLSIVYQHAYLFPHLTVRENVGYGSPSSRVTVAMLERFGLGDVAGRIVRVLRG